MQTRPNVPASRTTSTTARPPRFPFPGFPRGWFVVALSPELTIGAPPLLLHYFGRDLVAYRGTSGRAFVTSAYCPHLGAHLGHGGCVEGDTIRCPFHGWRFEGDGRCVEIPYSEHVPPRARLEAYPTREVNGAVHVFFDEAGGTPWDLPALDDDGWTPGRSVHWRGLRTHAQEVFENTVDITHIGPVHGGRGARLIHPPRRDSERLVVELEFEAPGDIVDMPGTLNDVHLLVSLLGLGVVVVETHVRNAGVRARQCIYATPVDEESIDIRGVVQVRVQDDAAFTDELARLFHHAYVEDFARDFPIWENKRYLERPAICKGDGPIGVYRHWCEQFYSAEPRTTQRSAVPSSAPAADGAEEPGERDHAARAPSQRQHGPGTPDERERDHEAGAPNHHDAATSDERDRHAGARDDGNAVHRRASRPDVHEWALRARRALAPVTTRAQSWLASIRDGNERATAADRTHDPSSGRAGTRHRAGDRTPVTTIDGQQTGAPSGAAHTDARGAAGRTAPAEATRTAHADGSGATTSPFAPSRRITSAHEYFETLERRFVSDAAAGLDAVFQWELAGPGGETFHAVVRDRRIDVRPGAHDRPTVALVMAADDYVRVVNGELDGTWAFTSGRGKVRGSLSAAMKMRALFPA